MTILKCSATTCAYNEDMLCSRGEIDMMGESAQPAAAVFGKKARVL